jgi:transformation/transcription domain-associated protein
MMFNMLDILLAKDTPQGAAKVIGTLYETCIERVEALTVVQQEVIKQIEASKNGQSALVNAAFIEKARPVGGAIYALEKPEDVLAGSSSRTNVPGIRILIPHSVLESKLIFRTLQHGFRVCLSGLRKCADGRALDLDGTLIFRMFEACIRCMSLFDQDPRGGEPADLIEWFGLTMVEINLHVFQEVWTQKIGFFFQCAQKKVTLLSICGFLFNRESCSPTLLAIVLKFLVDRLPQLGEDDDLSAAANIRLFKLAFNAVATHTAANEPILAAYIGKLLLDCFPLAAKASKPSHYFHLLRNLFRAIGAGGGRFELLYKEVLPLLPEMLENLNRQIYSTEGPIRDLIVELCLTVPLRLTHLLPHLTYLMHPLVLALKGSAELVSQGLRTLELCIDNLTPDFLDPTLNTVLRELMEALQNHLKPLPANHMHAHTTIRVLGKLGGRNRRLLTKEPMLKYMHDSTTPKITVPFSEHRKPLELGPVAKLAAQTLKQWPQGPSADRLNAFQYLEAAIVALLRDLEVSKHYVRTW